MLENIENFIKDFLVSLETAKLYEQELPAFKKYVDKAFFRLEDIFKDRDELVIGIIGEEVVFQKEIFFELSKLKKPEILYLKRKGIERIGFCRGVSAEEFSRFIGFLASTKEELKPDLQENLKALGIKNISVGRMKAAGAPVSAKLKASIDSLSLYESSSDEVSQTITDVLDMGKVDHVALKFSISNMMENLATQHKELLKLTTVKKHTLETFTHLLNVSILSMYFGAKLGFAKDAVLDLGISALFHDIGKLYISRKVITKKGGLSDEEFAQIKSHSILGAELMLRYVDSLGVLPVIVSFEHHLKYDLSGYPRMPNLEKQHIATRIIAICDVYDALSERRGYKVDYPPDTIFSVMMKEKGSGFDPELIDKFFKIMGVWPIGSIVTLSNETVAVVVDENEEDIYSPKVEVISPIERKEVIDLKENKEIKIVRYLNPWTEGKHYMLLIGVPPPTKKN